MHRGPAWQNRRVPSCPRGDVGPTWQNRWVPCPCGPSTPARSHDHVALHVNGGPYDPGPTQQSCWPQLSITHSLGLCVSIGPAVFGSPSAWPLGRQSSFFPSRPSDNSGPWNGPRFNRQKTCTCVSQDSNRIPDGSQEKALPLSHWTFLWKETYIFYLFN